MICRKKFRNVLIFVFNELLYDGPKCVKLKVMKEVECEKCFENLSKTVKNALNKDFDIYKNANLSIKFLVASNISFI